MKDMAGRALRDENERLRGEAERLRYVLGRLVVDFEGDFVIDGEIVDEPQSRWSPLPSIYLMAKSAMEGG